MEGFIPLDPPAGQRPDAALRSYDQLRPPGPLAPPNWPARGVWLSSRRRARRPPGRGRVWISPEDVSFAQESQESGIRFEHTGDTMVMITSRLRPPWANTFLILRSGSTLLRVRVSGFARRRIRRAIRAAGLTVRESTSWTAPASTRAASRPARHRGRDRNRDRDRGRR